METSEILMSVETHQKIKEYLEKIKLKIIVFDELIYKKFVNELLVSDGVENFHIKILFENNVINTQIFIRYMNTQYSYQTFIQ
jgi:hypothetical protein